LTFELTLTACTIQTEGRSKMATKYQ